MPMKKGAVVRQVLPEPIEGEVIDARYDADTGDMQYQVEWTDGEHMYHRWFGEAEVKEVK